MKPLLKNDSRKALGLSTLGVILAVTLGAEVGRRRNREAEERLVAEVAPHPSLSREDRLRIARALEDTLGELVSRDAFDAQMSRALGRPVRGRAERKSAARALSARGLCALSASQLDEVYAIRLALAEASPAVCVGLWSGRVADGEVLAALARLPPEKMRRWFELSREGVRAALRPGFALAPEDGAAIDAVMTRARGSVVERDRPRFDRAADQGPDAAPLEGCATMIDVLRAAQTAPAPLRERFYRTMARP